MWRKYLYMSMLFSFKTKEQASIQTIFHKTQVICL